MTTSTINEHVMVERRELLALAERAAAVAAAARGGDASAAAQAEAFAEAVRRLSTTAYISAVAEYDIEVEIDGDEREVVEVEVEPKRKRSGKSKALVAAEKRLEMAVDAGASAESIDVLAVRVQKLGGRAAKAQDESESFVEKLRQAAAEVEKRQAESDAAAEILRQAGGDALAAHEPVQVLAVARGGKPRWIRSADGSQWLIVADAESVAVETVEVWRKDGTSSVEPWCDVLASGEVEGRWIAVLQPLPKPAAEPEPASS